jgi:N-acetylneuraminic acid mutarotase
VPAPKPVVAPVPAPKPVIAPVPAPKPIVAPVPAPKPVVAPMPAPKPVVAPVPAPKPVVAPVPVPAPKPVVAPVPVQAPIPIGQWTQLYTPIEALVNVDNCFVMANNGRAYSIGGRSRKPVCEFNPQLSDWKCNKAYPPVVMHHMQCVVIGDEIWVPTSWTGDTNNYENTNDLMYIYNTQTNTWRNKTGLPNGRRRAAAASVYHAGFIYIVGGNYGGHGDHATSVPWFDRYEVSTGTWTQLANANKARDHVGGGIVDNGKLLCIAGGRDGGQVDQFERSIVRPECYSFATKAWSLGTAMPTPRSSSAYGTSCDGKLIIAGGEGSGQAYKTVNVFDGTNWTSLPVLHQKRTSTGLAVNCACGGEELYIANGSNQQNTWNTTRPMEKIVLKAKGSC